MTMSDEPTFLFALSARSGSFDQGCLTLNDVPLAIYFSDRPNRIVGHVPVAQLLELWDEGPNSLAEDPPNTVLSILGKTGGRTGIESTVIELFRPRQSDNSVAFDIRVLSGKVPAAFRPAAARFRLPPTGPLGIDSFRESLHPSLRIC